MQKTFVSWSRKGTNFLAFPVSAGFMVIDDQGNNYGSWITVERFRDLQVKGHDLTKPLDGCKVTLSGNVKQN